MDMDKLLVILPTYNERENLEAIVAAVAQHLPTADVLVIDDGSPDGTGALADGLASANPKVHVHHRSGKLGLGTAYLFGFRWALDHGYDYVFEMDSDFSHDPADLPRLLAAARAGGDVVIGSRYVAGGGTSDWSALRQAISRGGGLYTRLVLGIDVRDPTAGFKCFRRAALEALLADDLRAEGFSFQIEVNFLAHRKGLRIVEVPITFHERRAGASKMSMRIFVEGLLMVWKVRFRR
jgi:dolichol-phosphate mannosyltransferase